MYEIKTDLKRALYSLTFLLSSLAMLIVIFLGAGTSLVFPREIEMGLSNGYHSQLILFGLSSELVKMAVPILSTLPYTTAFIDEQKSGFIKSYLIRCNKARYIRGKILGAGLSGGLSLSLAILISYLLSYLIYRPLEIADPMAISSIDLLIKKVLVFFFCGCLWSSLGSLLANISSSIYMAYAGPFVIYYVLIILSERYFHNIYVINPSEWLNPNHDWPGGDLGIILLIALLIFILMIINVSLIERRIEG